MILEERCCQGGEVGKVACCCCVGYRVLVRGVFQGLCRGCWGFESVVRLYYSCPEQLLESMN